MFFSRQCTSQEGLRTLSVARLAVFGFVLCEVVCACAATGAHAGTRFGDSTWVAPTASFAAEPVPDGPRVAPRDHERTWETVLRTPFRVAFLPLRGVGRGFEAISSYVGPRYFDPKPNRPPPTGPHLGVGFTLGGVSDVGVGPALRWNGFPTAAGKLTLAASMSTVDRRLVRLKETIGDRRPVSFRLRADYDYKPDHRYYGIGNATARSDSSYYLLEGTSAEATFALGRSPLRQLRLVGGYSSLSPRRGYFGSPLLEDVYAPGTVPFEHQSTHELSFGLAGDAAALDDARDPSRGVHGRFDVRRQVGVRASDPDYDQWRVEGRAYVPVFATRRVLAFRAVYAGVDPRGGGATPLPYYRLVQSEGLNRFAGYSSERFRDRQLLLAHVEYRWRIIDRLSALALYELAEVAPRAGAFTVRDAHRSYGGGLRVGMSDVSSLRLDLAKGTEGLHAYLTLGSDF